MLGNDLLIFSALQFCGSFLGWFYLLRVDLAAAWLMGESLLKSPTNFENEMDESGTDQEQVGNGGTGELQVSVSFGKYENESLSWEKWSAFPTNKYLEEVEKCSTPGSVAQKKAYFEAHYKRIAARKSAEQQQPLQIDHGKKEGNEFSGMQQVSLEDQTTQDSTGNNCVDELDAGKSMVEDAVNTVDSEYRNEGGVNMMSEIGDACVDESNFVVDVEQSKNSQLVVEYAEERSGSRPESPKSNKAEELVFIKEEAPSLGSVDMEDCQPDSNPDKGTGPVANQAIKELQQDVDSSRESTQVQKQEKVKPETAKKQQKVSTTKKPSTAAGAKKKMDSSSPRPMSIIPKTAKPAQSKSDMSIPKTAKPALPRSSVSSSKTPKSAVSSTKTAKPVPPKSVLSSSKTAKPALSKSVVSSPKTEKRLLSYPVMCTPKTSKPALSKSAMSTTRSLVKKENSSTPLITYKKTSTKTECKGMGPTSLHISMSLCPAKSEPSASLPEIRKSLFMESMGDKEIVRRAFKTFQNRYSQQTSSGLRRPSSAGTQASKKEREIGGSPLDTSRKKSEGAAKASRRSSMSSGYNLQSLNEKSSKTIGADQRNVGMFSRSFGPRSVDKVEKPKESEEKLNSELAADTQPQARPKVQKRDDTKKLGRSLDLNSKPTTASYQRPRVQKAH